MIVRYLQQISSVALNKIGDSLTNHDDAVIMEAVKISTNWIPSLPYDDPFQGANLCFKLIVA